MSTMNDQMKSHIRAYNNTLDMDWLERQDPKVWLAYTHPTDRAGYERELIEVGLLKKASPKLKIEMLDVEEEEEKES